MQTCRWYDAVADCERRGEDYVLVTVLGVAGSVPREPTSKMVVTAEDTYDSIGGGHLEFNIVKAAREKLATGNFDFAMQHFPLGASLGQCCGGSVAVLLEPRPTKAFVIAVFGAGHVARALITILGQLDCRVLWIDSRADLFPDETPRNVECRTTDDPAGEIDAVPTGAHHLILTHNHQLDFDLCMALLRDGRAASIGLIGSDTKAERFRQRLAHRGFDEATIDRIRCPVGLSEVPGKLPMAVAVSIAGELLKLAELEQDHEARRPKRGLSWSEMRRLIAGDVSNPDEDA